MMNKLPTASIVVIIAAMAAISCSPPPDPYQAALDKLKSSVFPALVRIDVRKYEYESGEKRKGGGTGSGVVFNSDGYILTNYHVAGRAKKIDCILYNKERIPARLVGDDPWTDLAVIQLDMDEVREKGIKLYWAPLGDSDSLETGEKVMALGTPFGLARTITKGIVSNNERVISVDEMTLPDGSETGIFNTWIQTDAAINPGNSGGPLVNLKGEVVGINTMSVLFADNLGFTVPVNTAKEIIGRLMNENKVSRSWIGIMIQPLSELESYYDIDMTRGVLIRSVVEDSPAERAGIKAEDIMLSYDGRDVFARFPEEIPWIRKLISDTPVGKKLEVVIKRGDEIKTLSFRTEELGKSIGRDEEFEKWGFTGRSITQRMARRRKLDSTEGILVTGVKGGGPAYKAKLQKEDVIRVVNGNRVESFEGFKKLYEDLKGRTVDNVLMEVERGRGINFALLEIQEESNEQDEK